MSLEFCPREEDFACRTSAVARVCLCNGLVPDVPRVRRACFVARHGRTGRLPFGRVTCSSMGCTSRHAKYAFNMSALDACRRRQEGRADWFALLFVWTRTQDVAERVSVHGRPRMGVVRRAFLCGGRAQHGPWARPAPLLTRNSRMDESERLVESR